MYIGYKENVLNTLLNLIDIKTSSLCSQYVLENQQHKLLTLFNPRQM